MSTQSTQRFRVGKGLGPLVKPPISKTQLVEYSEASGDFNPIHTVENFALEAGLGGVIAHGMLTMAFVGQMLTNSMGEFGDLLKFNIRFNGMVRPGDIITAEGLVLSVFENGNKEIVVCEVWATREGGTKIVSGQAEFSLPTVEHPVGGFGRASD